MPKCEQLSPVLEVEGPFSEKQKKELTGYRRRVDGITTEISRSLGDTAFVRKKEWEQSDVEASRRLLENIAPLAHDKINSSYWDDVLASAICHEVIAEQTGGAIMSPAEAAGTAYFDRVGKLVTARYPIDRFMREVLVDEGGIDPKLLENLHDFRGILGIDCVIPFPDLDTNQDEALHLQTEAAKVNDVATMIGRVRNGKLCTTDEIKAYASGQPRRYPLDDAIWPIETQAITAINEGRQTYSTAYLLAEIDYLQTRYGVDFDTVSSEVMRRYNADRNQEWLRTVKDAQETLDPRTSESLGKKPITTVVFDIGGVLLNTKDDEILTGIAQQLDVSEESVAGALKSLDLEGKAGRITEEEYLRRFYKQVGRPFPDELADAREPFVQPDLYQPIEGMKEIIRSLARNPNVNLVILSDLIASVGHTVLDKVLEYYPELNGRNFLFSYAEGVSKEEPGSPAFDNLLNSLPDTDPSAIVMVDDRSSCIDAAKVRGIRGLTFREQHSNNRTGAERLNDELTLAGLI